MAAPDGVSSACSLAVLTKTVARSPVVQLVLHGSIRHRKFNDVIFVGDDFIHIKQVSSEGHLEHIISKTDFGQKIKAASILDVYGNLEHEDEDDDTDTNSSPGSMTSGRVPPQLLVLTLGFDDLLFLYLETTEDGRLQFVHSTCPLPRSESTLFQAGPHLAIDPLSRAMAVGANEREIVLYSLKSRQHIIDELGAHSSTWTPVAQTRQHRVEGVIQHMAFLRPPDDDEDHIVLLLIVIHQRKTKAQWIEWSGSSDLHDADVHPAQVIEAAKTVSSLLIPLRDAAFLHVTGNEMRLYQDILSGSLHCRALEPLGPGQSGNALKPAVWASWCRPVRNRAATRGSDFVYIAREDGVVVLCEITSGGNILSSVAATFSCHVGSAFASLGAPRDPDILVVAGDQSAGSVVSIGHWSTLGRIGELSRAETMEPNLIETLPNWASATDMITTTLPQSRGRSPRLRDSVFVTSGQQPYGSITELRNGFEARLSTFFTLPGLRSVTSVWALPDPPTGSLILLLTSPHSTRVIDMSANLEEVTEVADSSGFAFEMSQRTLAADITAEGHLIQATEYAICVTAGKTAGFEDKVRKDCAEFHSIIACAIEPDAAVIVCVESQRSGYALTCTKHVSHNPDGPGADHDNELTELAAPLALNAEPLGVAIARVEQSIVAIIASADGMLHLVEIDLIDGKQELRASTMLADSDQSLCDNVVLLREKADSSYRRSSLLAACGMRDGHLKTVQVSATPHISFGTIDDVELGQSTVQLVQHSSEPHLAYALSGVDTCVLSRDPRKPASLSIQNIWVSDKARPELAQGSIMACTKMPNSNQLSSPYMADALVLVSSEEIMISTLDQIVTTVPRQIQVTGTPNRLIYAEQQRCLVSASLCTAIRSFPSNNSHSRPEGRMQKWPVIEFIPSNKSAPAFSYTLQPGERVWALMEWSYRTSEDKVYSYILVGGRYMTANGSERGRVAFLQPVNRNWDIVNVTEGKAIKFEAPVYALALYDDITFIACYGEYVILSRYSVEDKRWASLCEPFKIASPGISVSVSDSLIIVLTMNDSFIALKLETLPDGGDDEFDFALVAVSMGSRADNALGHAVVDLPGETVENGADGAKLVLLSNKRAGLIGMAAPPARASSRPYANSSKVLFEARFLRSLTRVRRCAIRPRWKPAPPPGVLLADLLGCAADGTLVGASVISSQLWRRLSWLQRLCEWSPIISPYTHENPPYTPQDDDTETGAVGRAMPIGLRGREGDEVLLIPPPYWRRESDLHIDGDILSRLLDMEDAPRVLRDYMNDLKEERGRVGIYVREHLDEESRAVDGIVEELRHLVDLWL